VASRLSRPKVEHISDVANTANQQLAVAAKLREKEALMAELEQGMTIAKTQLWEQERQLAEKDALLVRLAWLADGPANRRVGSRKAAPSSFLL
jgi:fructoselysine-6-P-deglycase FrlB-like protein